MFKCPPSLTHVLPSIPVFLCYPTVLRKKGILFGSFFKMSELLASQVNTYCFGSHLQMRLAMCNGRNTHTMNTMLQKKNQLI